MSCSVLRNEGRHWHFVLRSPIEKELRVKREPFKRFRDHRKSIPRRFKTSIRKNHYKKSRLISFLELTSVRRSDLTAALFTVPFSGSLQYDWFPKSFKRFLNDVAESDVNWFPIQLSSSRSNCSSSMNQWIDESTQRVYQSMNQCVYYSNNVAFIYRT